ncbi:MAG: histidine kinase [Nakamurella sp.]
MAEAQRQDITIPESDGRIPPAATDIALAVVVTAAVAFATAAKVEPEALDPDFWAYSFAVVLGGLMLVRRRWPAGVLITTMVLLYGYYKIGYPAVGVSVPIAGAVYSAAEQGRLRLAIAVSATALVISTLYRITEEPLAKVLGFEGAQNLILLVAVIALGDGVRSRRELRRQTRLRAEQAQVEHDARASALVEQERLRIARDVHDVIAHSVSAISIQSVVGLEALPAEPSEAATALRNIRQVSATALAELRSAVGVLRDPGNDSRLNLAPVGGLADLDGLVATAAANGLQVTVRPTGTAAQPHPAVPLVVDATAHRIVQEAVTNVLRHSDSEQAVVEVDYRPTELHLRISNTVGGQLVPAGSRQLAGRSNGSATGGFGIAGMRERVELLGGSLTAAPTGQGGFEVAAVLPFPPRDQPAAP